MDLRLRPFPMSAIVTLMYARGFSFVIATRQSMSDVTLFCVLICYADVGFSRVNYGDVHSQKIRIDIDICSNIRFIINFS